MNHTSSATKISVTGLGTHTVFYYEEEEIPPVTPKNAAKGDNNSDAE
tara:strand:- start:2730 stop:2870 length:141 start_codon:yes stop_codon:yes gene_type:complete